jgi:hypothetical protein
MIQSVGTPSTSNLTFQEISIIFQFENLTMISWHRLLGLTLTDFFTGSNYEVELEKNLTKPWSPNL